MSKFCSNCGAQMDDYAAVCGNCGSAFEEPAATPVAPVQGMPTAKKSNPFEKLPKKTIGIVGVAVAVLVVLIIVISALSGSGAEKAAAKMLKASYNEDAETLAKYAYNFGSEDLADDMDDAFDNDVVEDLEDEYGKDCKVKVKVIDSYEYDEDDSSFEDVVDSFGDFKNALKNSDKYDDVSFSKDDIKKVVVVGYKVTISGKDDSDCYFGSQVMIKIGSKWYSGSLTRSGLYEAIGSSIYDY